ncbi:MAG: lysylphosphatidylglycerol synthase transmembrane domain-containing protein [Desulfobacterales bacterium]
MDARSITAVIRGWRWSRYLYLAAAGAVVAGCWVTLSAVDVRRALRAVAGIDAAGLVLLIAVNVGILASMSLRWHLMLRRLGRPVSLIQLALCRIAANSISYLTPGPQFGGEPFQIHYLVRFHGSPVAAATASVTTDRMIELLGNFLFLAVGSAFAIHHRASWEGPVWLTGAALVSVMVTVAVYLCLLWAGAAPLSGVMGRVYSKHDPHCRRAVFSAWLGAVESNATRILRQPFSVLAGYALVALFHWIGILGELWLIYAVLGLPLGGWALLSLAVAARLAFLMPIPGALGALEASQMAALYGLGLEPAIGLAACLIMRARDLILVASGSGLAAFWFCRGADSSADPDRP